MSDATQLDLVVIGNQQLTTIGRNKRRSEHTTFIGADRNIVEVRTVRTQSTRSSNRLIKRGMNAIVSSNFTQQPLAVGAPQLVEFTMPQQWFNKFGPLVTQLLKRCCVGRIPTLRFANPRRTQLVLVVQQRTKLRWRVQVEIGSIGNRP